MEKKFLAFSCIGLLISIGFFILTKPKKQLLIENQQGEPEEPDETFVVSVPKARFPPPKQESSNPEPTEEEWEEFEAIVRDIVELEEQVQNTQMDVNSETGTGKIKISPELEARFIDFRVVIKRDNAIMLEMNPYVEEALKLGDGARGVYQRLVEANANGNDEEKIKLYDELRRFEEQSRAVGAFIEPYQQRRRQIQAEFEQKYGISLVEFHNQHVDTYRLWWKENQY